MPRLVLYEHIHLSEEENKKADLLLSENNFILEKYRGDTIAIRHP